MNGRRTHRRSRMSVGLAVVFAGAAMLLKPSGVYSDTYVVSGGPLGSETIGADDDLVFRLNGANLMADSCPNYACHFGPFSFSGQAGDILEISAHDIGGCRSHTAVWVHNLTTGESEQLLGTRLDGCGTYVYEPVFEQSTHVLSGSANVTVPLNFRAVYGDDDYTIRLLWNTVPGVTAYRLYRGPAPAWAGDRTFLGEVAAPPYDDTFFTGSPQALQGWWYFIEAVVGANVSDWRASKAQAYGVTRHAADTARERFIERAQKAFFGVLDLACSLSGNCSLPDAGIMSIVNDWLGRVMGPERWPYRQSDYVALMTLCPVDIELRDAESNTVNKTNAEAHGMVYIEGDFLSAGVTNDLLLIPQEKAAEYKAAYPPEPLHEGVAVTVVASGSDQPRVIISNEVTSSSAVLEHDVVTIPAVWFSVSQETVRAQWYDSVASGIGLETSTNLQGWRSVPHLKNGYLGTSYRELRSTDAAAFFRLGNSAPAEPKPSVVTTVPAFPDGCGTIVIRYEPNDGELWSASSVRVHLGRNGWQDVVEPDPVMLRRGGYYEYAHALETGTYELNAAFHNGYSSWDNNGGANWAIAIQNCGDAPVTVNPWPPTACDPISITYNPAGRPLESEGQVFIHIGRNGWQDVLNPDPVMTRIGSVWRYVYVPTSGTTNISMVFNNGGGVWDNNSYADWHVALPACE